MCGCGQNGKGGWLRTSRLGVRISPPVPCDCTQTGKAAKLKSSCVQVRFLSVAPNSESWVSGLNHLTANEARRQVPRVQISHSPPGWKRCFLKTSQCRRSRHKRVRLLSLPPFCKRRREGMAAVRKTDAPRSQWVRSPPLAPNWSPACHVAYRSGIIASAGQHGQSRAEVSLLRRDSLRLHQVPQRENRLACRL